MTIRDNKRTNKQNSQEAANLAAIQQHAQATATKVAPTAANLEVAETSNTPVRIQGETETTPTLDAALEAGIITPASDEVVADIMAAETQPNPEDKTMDKISNRDLIRNWVKSVPAVNTANVTKLNLSTMTGDILVTTLGLPESIPGEVAKAFVEEMGAYPSLHKYQQNMPTMLALISDTNGGVVTTKVLDLALLMAKPYIQKAIGKWDNFVCVVNSFLKDPEVTEAEIVVTTTVIDRPPESIAERCKRIQAEADAKRAAEAKVNQPTTTKVKQVEKLDSLINKPEPTLTMGDLVAEQANSHKSILDIMADRKK